MKTGLRKSLLFLCLSLILAALWACPQGWTIISLNSDKYEPSFSGNPVFQGKKINLLSFTNSSEETHPFYYYKEGEKLAYSTDGIVESYVWRCYLKAFRKAGFEVFEDVQQKSVPDFDLIITYLAENKFQYVVKLTKDSLPLFEKAYSVRLNPVDTATYNSVKLEQYAYVLMDKSVAAVLGDPEFQKAVKK